MFAQLFLGVVAMGSLGSQQSHECPVRPNDFGLVWRDIVPAPPEAVNWTASFEETRTMHESLVVMDDELNRPATRQEMIDFVCQSWERFRGQHVVALNSYAIRRSSNGQNEVVVQSIAADGQLILEPFNTVWPRGTGFIMVRYQPPLRSFVVTT